MRSALRDAELPPPAGGWERLRRELNAAAPEPVVPAAPAARRPAWRIYMPRIAAAAAAVLICIGAGEFLLRPDKTLKHDGTVIATTEVGGAAAADMPQQAEPESVQEALAQQVGLPRERDAEPSASIRRQTLLAAAQTGTAVGRSQAQFVTEPAAEKQAGGPESAAEPVAEKAVAEKSAAAEQSSENDSAAGQAAGGTSRKSSLTTAGRSSQRSEGAVSARTAFPDEPFVAYTQPRKTASFSLFAGGGVTGAGNGSLGPRLMYNSVSSDISSIVGNGDNMSLLKRNEYGESSFRHHQALSFGLAVRKEFAYGLSLESGVNYTLLRSDVRAQYSSDDVSQKLHFIGIPLRLNWQFFERGRFSLYIGAGGQVEKCVSAKFGSKSVDEPGVQWSALAAAGAQYRIGKLVGLYFEPEGSYYFTQTGLRTARTDSPLTLTLRLGMRLSF